MMKMKKAKEQKLFAFMDEILTKYNYSTEEMSVVGWKLFLFIYKFLKNKY